MERQLVVFDLGKEHFGVGITEVDAIIKLQEITRVPKSLNFVEGITNLRGSVLPVVDLRKRMSMEVQEPTNETRIVVVHLEDTKVGMIVDTVTEVMTIQDETIEPAPQMIVSANTAFITGIAKIDGRLIILLDLAKVLTRKEVAALSDVIQNA